ncbi:MAG: hypothetical protein AAGK14_01675 [Verrucomicrobiota bacterium]
MELLRILSLIGKLAGFVSSLHLIPMVAPEVGVIIFFVSSLIKDAVNRIGDFVDDGKENQSWRA